MLARLEAGESGVAVIDAFARELVTTGYLHNHARMWFASLWVHVEELPWELGAAFFFRHLLDGDAASNTLSWRWVAGLHTPGKRYFVRCSNLEKYLDPQLLADATGLKRVDDAAIMPIGSRSAPPPVSYPRALPVEQRLAALRPIGLCGLRTGIWLHDADGCPEFSPLAEVRPAALFVTNDVLTTTYWRGLASTLRAAAPKS